MHGGMAIIVYYLRRQVVIDETLAEVAVVQGDEVETRSYNCNCKISTTED